MRSRWLALLLFSALVLLAALPAAAQTFPADNQWLPLTQQGVPIGDPVGDQPGARDVVGDATSPAAFIYADSQFLYFRLRINVTVLQSANNYKSFRWACEIDTNADLQSYELVSMANGLNNPSEVELWQNTVQGAPNSPLDNAEQLLSTYPMATAARQAPASSMFGGDPDFFIDWAIRFADLAAAGVTAGTPLRFICGTSNGSQQLSGDLLSTSGQTTLTGLGSDPYLCGPTGCVSCNTSLACGPSCVACSGSTPHCDAVSGACVGCSSGNDCSGATPICDMTAQACVECVTDADCTGAATKCDTPTHTCTTTGTGGAGGGTASSSTTSSSGTSSSTTSSSTTSSGTTSSSGTGGAGSGATSSGTSSSTTTSSGGTVGAGGGMANDDGIIAQGSGCACGIETSGDADPAGLAAGALLLGVALRRRRRAAT